MQNNQQPNAQQPGSQGKPQLSWSQPAPAAAVQKPEAPKVTPPNRSKEAQPALKAAFGGKMIGIFVLGLLAGWLLTWGWFGIGHSNQNTAMQTDDVGALSVTQTQTPTTGTTSSSAPASGSQSATPATQTSDATLNVPSPQTAGMSVTVSSISTAQPVWAVVYEDKGGVAGNVLGAARFTPSRSSGTVSLLRSTLPNLNYFVGLDADTDGTFSIKANAQLTDSSGKPIMVQFTAQ